MKKETSLKYSAVAVVVVLMHMQSISLYPSPSPSSADCLSLHNRGAVARAERTAWLLLLLHVPSNGPSGRVLDGDRREEDNASGEEEPERPVQAVLVPAARYPVWPLPDERRPRDKSGNKRQQCRANSAGQVGPCPKQGGRGVAQDRQPCQGNGGNSKTFADFCNSIVAGNIRLVAV